MSGKSILIHLNSAPFGSSNAKEALDLVLAGGTFEQDIKFLLSNDACYLLLENQQPGEIHQKHIRKMMGALAIYGVETIFVDQADAVTRGIPLNECTLNTTKLNKAEVVDMIKQADIVIRF